MFFTPFFCIDKIKCHFIADHDAERNTFGATHLVVLIWRALLPLRNAHSKRGIPWNIILMRTKYGMLRLDKNLLQLENPT